MIGYNLRHIKFMSLRSLNNFVWMINQVQKLQRSLHSSPLPLDLKQIVKSIFTDRILPIPSGFEGVGVVKQLVQAVKSNRIESEDINDYLLNSLFAQHLSQQIPEQEFLAILQLLVQEEGVGISKHSLKYMNSVFPEILQIERIAHADVKQLADALKIMGTVKLNGINYPQINQLFLQKVEACLRSPEARNQPTEFNLKNWIYFFMRANCLPVENMRMLRQVIAGGQFAPHLKNLFQLFVASFSKMHLHNLRNLQDYYDVTRLFFTKLLAQARNEENRAGSAKAAFLLDMTRYLIQSQKQFLIQHRARICDIAEGGERTAPNADLTFYLPKSLIEEQMSKLRTPPDFNPVLNYLEILPKDQKEAHYEKIMVFVNRNLEQKRWKAADLISLTLYNQNFRDFAI